MKTEKIKEMYHKYDEIGIKGEDEAEDFKRK